ncbi:protein of unknown function [Candidatus Filomicrobium marinum]|nr:protein of unknown function [Candidatus Filomicrobium marinum]
MFRLHPRCNDVCDFVGLTSEGVSDARGRNGRRRATFAKWGWAAVTLRFHCLVWIEMRLKLWWLPRTKSASQQCDR